MYRLCILIPALLVAAPAQAQETGDVSLEEGFVQQEEYNHVKVRLGGAGLRIDEQNILGGDLEVAYGYERRWFMGELTAFEGMLDTGGDAGGLRLSFLRYKAAYIFSHEKEISPYLGPSLGLGINFFGVSEDPYVNGGIETGIVAGVQLMRHQKMRWDVELDIALPLYSLKNLEGPDDAWSPIIALKTGMAFQTERSIGDILLAKMERWSQ
ncbi:MAG: hypothetical protein ACI8S6_001744 [Myxococcota bacterium]|jgi:hypothetical protein